MSNPSKLYSAKEGKYCRKQYADANVTVHMHWEYFFMLVFLSVICSINAIIVIFSIIGNLYKFPGGTFEFD